MIVIVNPYVLQFGLSYAVAVARVVAAVRGPGSLVRSRLALIRFQRAGLRIRFFENCCWAKDLRHSAMQLSGTSAISAVFQCPEILLYSFNG